MADPPSHRAAQSSGSVPSARPEQARVSYAMDGSLEPEPQARCTKTDALLLQTCRASLLLLTGAIESRRITAGKWVFQQTARCSRDMNSCANQSAACPLITRTA